MTAPTGPPAPPVPPGVVGGAERHASWLELFFDLVAVAGIGMLAHLVGHDAGNGGIAVYVLAYVAIWMLWACFTMYGNLAADRTFVAVILGGMSALGVMIAAVPEVRGEHATAFAVAYVVGRLVVARPWERTTVVIDLPVVQTSIGILPWVVSWWFDGPTQYVLWAVGLGLDLLLLLTTTRERLVEIAQGRLDRARRTDAPRVEVAEADVPHLTERLGLFVLIVIGEGLVQIIDGASTAEWDRALAVSGAGAFALMFGLWAIAVRFGHAGVALLPEGALAPRLSWAVHLPTTMCLAAVAAVLGGVVAAPHDPLADRVRWVAVTAYVGYAVLCAGVHLARRSLWRAAWVGLPMTAAAAVAAFVPVLSDRHAVWVLAAGVLASLLGTARGPRPGTHANMT